MFISQDAEHTDMELVALILDRLFFVVFIFVDILITVQSRSVITGKS